jgi:Ca2+-binding RTX toxin-like protein
MRPALLAGVIAALAAAAPHAFASTADVGRQGVTNYKAAPGEANRLTVSYRKSLFTFVDKGAKITPVRRCKRRPHKRMRCNSRIKGHHYAPNINLYLADGNDRATVKAAKREGYTTVFGGAGNDVVKSGSGVVYAYLFGDSGNDRLAAGASKDELDGGVGNDVLSGGAGPDILYGNGEGPPGPDADRLDGGAGNDILNGGAGDDTFVGGTGNDVLGNGSGDSKDAGDDPGADTLDGGPGNDVLSGLDGNSPVADHITCGPGNDHAVVDQLDSVSADCELVERRQQEPEPIFF